MNLEKLFGETVFAKHTILGCGDDKDEALEQYRNSGYVWVEDKVENAIVGAELGLESLVMEHGFNMNDEGPFTLVKDWKDIYETLIGK